MTESSFWKKGLHYLIVSVIFLGIGIKFCWIGFTEVSLDLKIKNWRKIPAKIESFEVKPIFYKHSRAGNLLLATYSYEIAGKKFDSNRVAIDPTFSSSPDELIAARNFLEQALASDSRITAMVDPEKSNNSMLFMPFPFHGYFYVLAGAGSLGIHILLEIFFILTFRVEANREGRRRIFPDQPWKWEESWQNLTITGENKFKKMFPLFGFTFILAILSVALAILVLLQPQITPEGFTSLGFLALFNMLLFGYCLRKLKGESWADAVSLKAESFPLIPGENWPFSIIIDRPSDMEILAGLKVFLKFTQKFSLVDAEDDRETTGIRSGTRVEREFFEDGRTCFKIEPRVKSEQDKIILECEVFLPQNVEITNHDHEFPAKWQISLFYQSSSKEFIETFEIPVYSIDVEKESENSEEFGRLLNKETDE